MDAAERAWSRSVGTAFGAASEEKERWFAVAAEREQGAEVGVGGDHDALLGAGAFSDLLVAGDLEAVVP